MPFLIAFIGVICFIITALDLCLDRCFSKRLFFYCGGRDYDYRMDMLISKCLHFSTDIIFDDCNPKTPIAVTFNLLKGEAVSFQVCTSIKDFSELGILFNMEKYPSWYSPNMRPSFEVAERLYEGMRTRLRRYYSNNLLD